MAGEWHHYKVGDLFDLVPGFAFKSKDFKTSGVPVIKIKNVKANAIVLDDLSYVDHGFLQSRKDKIVHQGDILTTMSGNRFGSSKDTWVGKVADFRSSGAYLLNQRVGILRPKRGVEIDRRCCSYILGSGDYQAFFIAIATSSGGQANLSPDQILGAEILLPPINEQRAIAQILGTLDDKIDLTRRMNETLEAMARAVFQSWFVDFDPVRAKAEGRDPGLPKPIADLFPDRFEDSELGEIPAGWGVGCVDDEFDLTMGQSPPGDTYNEAGEGVPFYQGRADFSFRFPMRRVYCTAATRFAKAGDTLISVRAPVGDINMASEHCAIGRGVAAARHKTGSRSYSYQFMRSLKDVFVRFEAEGTVFGSIGKKDFHAIPCVMPPRDLVVALERHLSPIDECIEVNERESRTLAALRDALLPKLISGELRVKDAECVTGGGV